MPWLWPVVSAVKAARRMGWEKGAASLRSLAEGGWPLQQKIWAEGGAAHNWCRCKEAAGTLWHKLGSCSRSERHRSASCSEATLKGLNASPWNPLYSRGVPARPKDPPLTPECTWHELSCVGIEKIATKRVYTDGSAKGRFWRAARAGWGFVVLDDEGKWLWTAKGTLAGPNCSSFRLEALRVTMPPATICVDKKAVVDGVQRGERCCTASGSSGADL